MNRLFDLAVDPSDLGMSLLTAGTQAELQAVIGTPPAQTHERLWSKPRVADFPIARKDGWEFIDYDKGVLMHGVPQTTNENSMRTLGHPVLPNHKFSVHTRTMRYAGSTSYTNQGIYVKQDDGSIWTLGFGRDGYDFQVYLQKFRSESQWEKIGAAHEFMKYGANDIWLRWDCEGTLLRGYFSVDGYFWQPLTTVAVAEVRPMVECGIYINPNMSGANAITFRLETAASFQHFFMEQAPI